MFFNSTDVWWQINSQDVVLISKDVLLNSKDVLLNSTDVWWQIERDGQLVQADVRRSTPVASTTSPLSNFKVRRGVCGEEGSGCFLE